MAANRDHLLCRGEGIRTPDTLVGYTHFPSVRLKPLGHSSKYQVLLFGECK